jgi:RNA polymerase sigma-70 factor, ECF subfamily
VFSTRGAIIRNLYGRRRAYLVMMCARRANSFPRMQTEQAQISDNDLLRAIARGDETALAGVYDRYRLILFSLILRILHDREEAEDVLQETFLQVWRRARDFDETRGRGFTWLVTIARSRALDRLRASASRARVVVEAAQAPREETSDVAQESLRSERSERVRSALADLPDEQKRALFLAYFEDMTQTEIAAKLNAPLGTIKTRMRSGMMRLRDLLRGEFRDSI